jgi:hypothetical protein
MDRLIVDNFLPELAGGFFLVGVEGARSDDRYTHDLVQVDVQAGGLSCLHYTLTGLIFRLADAGALALRELAPLLNAFDRMSENGQVPPPEPADARLMVFSDTRGEDIDAALLQQALDEYLPLPRLREGVEALVRAAPSVPREHFAAWPLWKGALLSDALEDQLVTASEQAGQPVRAFLVWGNSD